jgi:phosphate-selective porin
MAFFVLAGFLLPGSLGPGRLQPVVKVEKIESDGVDNDTSSWAGGLNYYLKDHNAKVMAEYLRVNNEQNANTFSGTAGKDRDAITLVLSFGI